MYLIMTGRVVCWGGATLDSSGSFSRAPPALHQCSIHRTTVRVHHHYYTRKHYVYVFYTQTHRLTQHHPLPMPPPPSTRGHLYSRGRVFHSKCSPPSAVMQQAHETRSRVISINKKNKQQWYIIDNHHARLIWK